MVFIVFLRIFALVAVVGGLIYAIWVLYSLELMRRRRREAARQTPVVSSRRPWSFQRLLGTVHFYRQLGFYDRYAGLSDEDLAKKFQGEAYDPPRDTDELFRSELAFLAVTTDLIWWNDLKCVDQSDDRTYARAIAELAAISRGAFKPTEIDELWRETGKQIDVTFQLHGRRELVQPEIQGKQFDLRILDPINGMIRDSGRAFEIVASNDQSAAVLCLTPEEKNQLMERGWRFGG